MLCIENGSDIENYEYDIMHKTNTNRWLTVTKHHQPSMQS